MSTPTLYPGQRGFSIIEVMVGMLIGLLGILVMFQMLERWDQQKRTASSGNDAQVSGSIAMYSLERDMRMAGYGFGRATNVMGCTVNAYDRLRPVTVFAFPLVPVLIADGAGGAPDTVTVFYGNSNLASASITYTTSTATSKTLSTRSGVERGDLILITQDATTCGLAETTDNTSADGITINHASGNYTGQDNTAATARYNAAAGLGIAFTPGSIYNLGPDPRRNIWQISNSRLLTSTDDLHYSDLRDSNGLGNPDNQNDWTEVADGIIDLQAEYGIRIAGIMQWSPQPPPNWAVPQAWSSVSAIRIGLLARSQQYEKVAVTTTAPIWAGGAFTMTDLDGGADSNPGDPNDWRHYRYRVYQAVIPLRNAIWGSTP